jgi:hypothetical protein
VRAFWPREYGAYAELAFPVITGFVIGGVSSAGAGFALAAACGFVVNEPLSVLKGLRGRRAQEELGAAARRHAGVIAALGAAAGTLGFAVAPGPARLAAVVAAALVATLVPSVAWGRPKTLWTEVRMAAAFAAMVGPVGLAGGAKAGWAAAASGTWFVCFLQATLAVHAIKARARPELAARWTVWAAPLLAALVVGVAGMWALARDSVPPGVAFAPVPTAVVVLAAAAGGAHPRHLKRVGWTLVAANLVTLALLTAP